MIEVTNLENIIPPEVLSKFNESAILEVLYDLADAARSEWIRLAGEEFSSTRRDYINGIQPVQIQSKGTAVIALVGTFPNLLEQGMPSVNMHRTLLGPGVPVVPRGSRGKHRSKDGGYFRSIPFRHSGPASGGASGQPMGKAYSNHDAVADAKKLGRAVYSMAKGLTATTSQPGGGVKYGGRLKSPINQPIAPKLRKHHASNIYEGMIREEKTYQKGTSSQYVTFRTIAVDANGNTKPKSGSPWIRPQTKGKFVAKRVNEFVQTIATDSFAAYLASKT